LGINLQQICFAYAYASSTVVITVLPGGYGKDGYNTQVFVSSFLQFVGMLLIIVHSTGRYVPSMTNPALLTKHIFDMGKMSFIVRPNFDWR